jgi:hypothetical protein
MAFTLRHIVLCLDAIFRLVYAATVESTPEGVSLLGVVTQCYGCFVWFLKSEASVF